MHYNLFTGNWLRKKFETPGVSELNDVEREKLVHDLITSTQLVFII